MLEDLGFYCIDNIPAALLKPFISYTVRSAETTYELTAIGLDARNTPAEVASVPQLIDELRRSGLQCEVVFLVAAEDELLGGGPARGEGARARAARADRLGGRPADRHLAPVGARTARHHP